MTTRYFLSALGLLAFVGCTAETPADDDDDDGGGGGSGGSSIVVGSGGASTGGSGGATTSSTTTASSGGAGGSSSQCANGPLAEPIPGCAPAPPPSTGDFHQDCVDRINQLRWECQCLPPLQRWTAAEACTDQQSNDDQQDGAHANFGACGESAQNTCPNYGSESAIIDTCLQQMWDEGPGEPFEEHGHYINMSSTSYTKVACGISSSGGWSNQNFSP